MQFTRAAQRHCIRENTWSIADTNFLISAVPELDRSQEETGRSQEETQERCGRGDATRTCARSRSFGCVTTTTTNHKVLCEWCEFRHYHRCIVVVRDLTIQSIQSHHVYQKLIRKRKNLQNLGADGKKQKLVTPTLPWNLASLARNYPGIIVRQHLTDRKQMGLLRERCSVWCNGRTSPCLCWRVATASVQRESSTSYSLAVRLTRVESGETFWSQTLKIWRRRTHLNSTPKAQCKGSVDAAKKWKLFHQSQMEQSKSLGKNSVWEHPPQPRTVRNEAKNKNSRKFRWMVCSIPSSRRLNPWWWGSCWWRNMLKITGTWMEKENYRMHGEASQDSSEIHTDKTHCEGCVDVQNGEKFTFSIEKRNSQNSLEEIKFWKHPPQSAIDV